MTSFLLDPVRPCPLASLAELAVIPEEDVWLASQKSLRTCRAYRLDVAHFMRFVGLTTPEQLRQVDHRAVIVWEGNMREQEGARRLHHPPPLSGAVQPVQAPGAAWDR